MRIRIAALMLVVSSSVAPLAWAQRATGEVNGTITDSTGAAIPAAAVRLGNQATGIENVQSANDSGVFLFVNVQPGNYLVHVSKPGFRDADVKGVVVGVNQAATVNVTLEVGSVSESVQVTAASPLIQSTSAELGTVITQRMVN